MDKVFILFFALVGIQNVFAGEINFRFGAPLLNLCGEYGTDGFKIKKKSSVCVEREADKKVSFSSNNDFIYYRGEQSINAGSIKKHGSIYEMAEYGSSGRENVKSGERGELKSLFKNSAGISVASMRCKTYFSMSDAVKKDDRRTADCVVATARTCELFMSDIMADAPPTMDSRLCKFPNALDYVEEKIAKQCQPLTDAKVDLSKLTTNERLNLFGEAVKKELALKKIDLPTVLDKTYGSLTYNTGGLMNVNLDASMIKKSINSGDAGQMTAEQVADRLYEVQRQCSRIKNELKRELKVLTGSGDTTSGQSVSVQVPNLHSESTTVKPKKIEVQITN